MKKQVIFTVIVLLFLSTLMFSAKGEAAETFSPYVDDKGVINLPIGYRANWTHLGSWIVPDKKAPGYGFHDVYTQTNSVEAYKKTGKFPDGAVLVKEIRKVISIKMTTGQTSYAGEISIWFVMIKDEQGRFTDNPNWGDGWGWALFKAANPTKNVSTEYRADCIGCHIPAMDNDWVYIEGYHTLR